MRYKEEEGKKRENSAAVKQIADVYMLFSTIHQILTAKLTRNMQNDHVHEYKDRYYAMSVV